MSDALDGLVVRAMEERDLVYVMPIEIDSFPDPWAPIAFLSDMQHNPRARYYVALLNEVVCGYLALWETSRGAEILKLAVAQNSREKGVGTLLVSTALEHLSCSKENGYVRVLVRASNVIAQEFYLRFGFAYVERFPQYYNAPPEDALAFVFPVQQM